MYLLLFQGRSISGALTYAVDQINNCTGLLPDVQLDFIYNDTQVHYIIISGALTYAVDQINNCTGLLPDVELDFIYNDTQVKHHYIILSGHISGVAGYAIPRYQVHYHYIILSGVTGYRIPRYQVSGFFSSLSIANCFLRKN